MGSCYALGTFTDNFYKQAAILIAASAQMTDMQSIATVLFSLPFILFSAWAGAVSDRVAKKTVVVAVKTLEFGALLIGGYMLVAENWIGMLTVMFCMGAQSTFFSPAINGSIPENFPPQLVPRANALIKLASTAAILAGMAAAGFVLDWRDSGGLLVRLGLEGREFGRVAAAVVVAVVALAGLLTALILRYKPASFSQEGKGAFPWSGPVASLKLVWNLRGDRPLMLVLLADAWFFGIAAIAVISIANMAAQLGYSKSSAGVMTALLMSGVAVGSLIAGRFSASSWRFLLIPAACGMAGMLCLVGVTPLLPEGSGGMNPQLLWFGTTLFFVGICGGIYLIPLESFIQVRPDADKKGRVIAVSNFLSFVAMALFGAAFSIISHLPPALTFVVYGLATFCFVFVFARKRLRGLEAENLEESASSVLGMLGRALLALRYSVSETGLEALPPAPKKRNDGKPGLLILPNHPALIDPVIVYSRLAGLAPRPLADERQMTGMAQKAIGRFFRVVTIPDSAHAGRGGMGRVLEGLQAVTEALRQGENVLFYPAGRVYRSDRECIGNNAGVFRILKEVPEARVLLVRTSGLWGSSFSHAGGKAPSMMGCLGRGALAVLANFILFVPKRKVRITYVETNVLSDLAGAGDKKEINRFLEEFFNRGAEAPVFVPRYFWQQRPGQAK
jgi:MFS family permease